MHFDFDADQYAFRDAVRALLDERCGPAAVRAAWSADAACVPTIHWAGTGKARSEWMFHLQVGSHEDEAAVLVRQIVTTGARSVGLVYDRSPIGKRRSRSRRRRRSAAASCAMRLAACRTVKPSVSNPSFSACHFKKGRPN